MTIADNKVVSIHYTVKDIDSGEVIDSSDGGEPMTYLHGAQNIIPGLEQALVGKSEGDQFDIEIAPADAYGVYSEERVQQVPKEVFEGVDEITEGMAFSADTDHSPVNLIVVGVDEDTVTVDANHPLAGKSLAFSVKVDAIRNAHVDEITQGHVIQDDKDCSCC